MERKEMKKRRHKRRNTERQLCTQNHHGCEYGSGGINGKIKKKSSKSKMILLADDQADLDTFNAPNSVDETSHPREKKRKKHIALGVQPEDTKTEVNTISLRKKQKRKTKKGALHLGKSTEETEVEGHMGDVMDSRKRKKSRYEVESKKIEPEVDTDGGDEYTKEKLFEGTCISEMNSLDGICKRKKASKVPGSKRKPKESKSEAVKDEALDAKKTTEKQRLGVESTESETKIGIDKAEEIIDVDEDQSKGMNKWLNEYWNNRPGLIVLQQKIDEFIVAQEAHEEQARKEQEALAAEGGWTVVVRNKGKKKTTDSESGISVGSVAHAAVLDNVAKKKKETPIDFYRFQKREAQRKEVMSLQSKFEQDKKRIQQVRAARKFRPY